MQFWQKMKQIFELQRLKQLRDTKNGGSKKQNSDDNRAGKYL